MNDKIIHQIVKRPTFSSNYKVFSHLKQVYILASLFIF